MRFSNEITSALVTKLGPDPVCVCTHRWTLSWLMRQDICVGIEQEVKLSTSSSTDMQFATT